jgi:hypothetical protein
MKYQIKYHYQTGDSFGTTGAAGILEMKWENLDVVKANLQRIKEHYDMVLAISRASWEIRMGKRNGTHEDITAQYQNKDWYVNDKDYTMRENCIILYADNGNPWKFWCPWCGYFECLHSAEIIHEEFENNDMKINF